MDVKYGLIAERIGILNEQIIKETDIGNRLNLIMSYGTELLFIGEYQKAQESFLSIYDFINQNNVEISYQDRYTLMSKIAITYLRQGEIENCLQFHNHVSCFIPIKKEGIHKLTDGSTKAIEWYTKLLAIFPDDLDSKYLLNLAYMTLGKYPDEVPKKYLVPPSYFQNTYPFPQFKEVAGMMGLDKFGLSGGVIVDDFTNDGWLDIVTTSYGLKEELVFYVNNGDGSFSDMTKAFNLDGQVGILQLYHTDVNNDGWLDLLLMRGGWYYGLGGEIPKTLLLNTGKGSFEDITVNAGLTKLGPSQSAAWTDIDLDGWLDLIIAYENSSYKDYGIDIYMNQKDNTFKNISSEIGMNANDFYKGIIAFDANNDRYGDFYLSSIDSDNALYENKTKHSKVGFAKSSANTILKNPPKSFPTFAFDFNNDGYEDLFVTSYNVEDSPANAYMKSKSGLLNHAHRPYVYKNNGNFQFTDVAVEMGITEDVYAMGCNFGDINVDGYLDIYLGTGNPIYQGLVPNKMYLNIEGKRFEDVSYSGGFSNIQKGHGVGFGDLDHDGDEDLYICMGGAYEGDGYYNCLFENPNFEKNNWVNLKLTGTTANKPAIGARVKVVIEVNGMERHLYRSINAGASFGGNSLELELGLGKATVIKNVEITWPCKDCPVENFTGLEINKAYQIVQGNSTPIEREYKSVTFKPMKEGDSGSGHHHGHH